MDTIRQRKLDSDRHRPILSITFTAFDRACALLHSPVLTPIFSPGPFHSYQFFLNHTDSVPILVTFIYFTHLLVCFTMSRIAKMFFYPVILSVGIPWDCTIHSQKTMHVLSRTRTNSSPFLMGKKSRKFFNGRLETSKTWPRLPWGSSFAENHEFSDLWRPSTIQCVCSV